jgi:hypothetical protein
MIDTEKYQPPRQNMKFVTRSLRSLATKLHIPAPYPEMMGTLLICISKMATPGRLQFSYDPIYFYSHTSRSFFKSL